LSNCPSEVAVCALVGAPEVGKLTVLIPSRTLEHQTESQQRHSAVGLAALMRIARALGAALTAKASATHLEAEPVFEILPLLMCEQSTSVTYRNKYIMLNSSRWCKKHAALHGLGENHRPADEALIFQPNRTSSGPGSVPEWDDRKILLLAHSFSGTLHESQVHRDQNRSAVNHDPFKPVRCHPMRSQTC
jgi:hypothetical protein